MKLFLRSLGLTFCCALLSIPKIQAQYTLPTNLPILYITTTGNLPVDSKETYRAGTLSISGPTGTVGAYNGAIEIRGRGNSTWTLAKKPYRIKLASKYALLGMPATEKNWVLLANYADKTLMRNAMAFEVSKFLGFEYSCPYRFVDVVLNNEYIGNYTLTDNIEVGPNRVAIDEQKVTDIAEPAITGGYLVEADGFADQEISHFVTTRGVKITIKSPDDDKIVPAQTNYISSYFQMIEDKLFASNFSDPELGYMKYMDQTSLINWYIASEVTGNSDAFWSTYMYKKRNDPKIYFGPLWDYDIAFNNDSRIGDATFKRMSSDANEPKLWIQRMLQDPHFKTALSKRWKELKAAGLKNSMNTWVTNFASTLNLSQQQNYIKWPVLNTKVYLEQKSTGTYAQHVEFLRNYISQRMDWLDMQMTGEFSVAQYYKIINRSTSKVISANNDGTLTVQKAYVDNTQNQQWALTVQTIDDVIYYKIINRASGKRLQIPGTVAGDQLKLLTDITSETQQWQIKSSPVSGYYQIINKGNNLAIDNAAGSSSELNPIVQYYADPNSLNQHWSLVAVDVNSNPLPIYTSGLTATTLNNKIELSWNVYDSKNGSYFEIERLSDKKLTSREVIGTVALREDPLGQYTFNDEKPLPGINYYRLKQIDLDGTFTYSSIVSAKNSYINQLALWPLPATDKSNISFTSPAKGEGYIELYNISGSILKTIPLNVIEGLNEYTIDISTLLQGLYMVKINYLDETATLKMMKAN